MKKDNFGICLSFYAVLAFVLAIFGNTTVLALLLGFVILVHKDQWLIRQVMQALFLGMVASIVNIIIGVISPIYSIPILGHVISVTLGAASSIIDIIILVIAIIAIMRVSKGQEAEALFVKGFAVKAFGIVRKAVYAQPPVQNMQYQQPNQNMNYQQSVQYQQPTYQQPEQGSVQQPTQYQQPEQGSVQQPTQYQQPEQDSSKQDSSLS